ncbi:hypothetical protein DL768_004786 [Monosporascus sp. mg162]|nr:hypothetical protein DL768_004786 [Monosporascus sp. mg162]
MALGSEHYHELAQWVEQAGGSLNPAVEIYHDEVTKGSFRVRDGYQIEEGDAIVTLPLSRSLSFLNAVSGHPDMPAIPYSNIAKPENSPYFPREFLEKTPPHVVGRFFLMQQYLLGRDGLWWPYIQTLPQPEHMGGSLPAIWPSDDVEFLEGTNAYVAVQEIKSTLKKEFKHAMKLLPDSFSSAYSRPLYLWAYSIFTSRSFRPSLILPSTNICGLSCNVDDFSMLLPLFDIGNHSLSAKSSWSTDPGGQACKLQSGQHYTSGDQVFNNYGIKTNVELLLGYGFMLPESPDFHNDYIHIKTKADTEAGDLTSKHLVSLRPLRDQSSLVGRSRLLTPDLGQTLECFSHIEDSLVVSLYETISRGAATENGGVSVCDIMQGNIPAGLKEKIINALGSKLSMDLEEIEAHDPQYAPSNRNQQLALHYREQCKKVLERALTTLAAHIAES